MGQQEAKKGEEDREGAEEEVEAPFTFSKGGGPEGRGLCQTLLLLFPNAWRVL